MRAFVRIVEANSFSKAAETLNVPRAALTATIQKLEAALGVQLLQRTTRRLSLTAEGIDYLRDCQDILQALEVAEARFRGQDAASPRGRLRVELPSTLGRNFILPRLAQFRDMYPDLELVISFTDRLVDLTEEGADCAVRVGKLQDSAMIGRQIGVMPFVLCAAPAYVARHGLPQTVAQLAVHRSVVHVAGRSGRAFDWDVLVDGKRINVALGGPVSVNDGDANMICALQGLGLARCATYQARAHFDDGSLVPVLPDASLPAQPISLVYPKGRMATPKLRVFADWLLAILAQHDDLRLVT
ncbi:LysR family transcriptional regulator [Massilia sp. S19_KUP03_FR1]|uniref:LysR substrate-binding domain-containing protein n=1 Tax=Massilia sp. S19_KUP03_FR1 TaxID=3025503 RepID=UPI002FCDB886